MGLLGVILSQIRRVLSYVLRLATDYTTGRAAKLDNLDVVLSSRLSDANAPSRVQTGLTGQGYTATRAGYLDALAGGSIVKSIQRGSGTVTLTAFTINGNTSVSISSVNTSKSIVIVNGVTSLGGSDGTTYREDYSAQLASSTSVLLTYSVARAVLANIPSATISFTVIEFN